MSRRELLGAGRMAEVFALDADTVVKLDRPEFNGVASHEAAILRALGELALPVPHVVDTIVLDGRHGIVMERLHGPALSAVIDAGGEERRLAADFVELHLALHRAAPSSAPPLVPRLAAEIEQSGLPSSTVERLLGWLARLDGEDGLCHFDLHPENVIVTDGGWRVIDWIGAAVGPTDADFARTLLLRSDATAGPMAEFMRHVHTIGSARRSVGNAELDRWTRILAAARLAEGFDGAEAARLRAIASGDAAPMR